MEKRHFSLTVDERNDRLAKALVSFFLVGVGISVLIFFSFSISDENLRWEQYISYFGKVVNPAVQLTAVFLFMWPIALLEYYFYLKKSFVTKSSMRLILNKSADKMYDLFPRLFLVIGGSIFATCILEIFFLPYSNNVPLYIFFQMIICVTATVIRFKMLTPRRLMLNDLINGWQSFYSYLIKMFRGS